MQKVCSKIFLLQLFCPYKLQVKDLKLFRHDKQDIVSVRMVIRIYIGGAHGNKFYYSWNWDRRRNKFISLNEIITPEQFQALIKHAGYVIFEKRKQKEPPKETSEEFEKRKQKN